MTLMHLCNLIYIKLCVIYMNWFQLRGVRNEVVGSHTWLNVKYIPADGSQEQWYRFAWALAFFIKNDMKSSLFS